MNWSGHHLDVTTRDTLATACWQVLAQQVFLLEMHSQNCSDRTGSVIYALILVYSALEDDPNKIGSEARTMTSITTSILNSDMCQELHGIIADVILVSLELVIEALELPRTLVKTSHVATQDKILELQKEHNTSPQPTDINSLLSIIRGVSHLIPVELLEYSIMVLAEAQDPLLRMAKTNKGDMIAYYETFCTLVQGMPACLPTMEARWDFRSFVKSMIKSGMAKGNIEAVCTTVEGYIFHGVSKALKVQCT